MPLRSLEEFELHITLIEGVLAKCRASVGRARRNHRHSEALLICGHELKQLNRMLNVKRHTTGGKKPV